jgi:hypothetical protein
VFDEFEDYEVLLIWMAGDLVFTILLALLMRHCLVHTDSSGKVNYAELPKLHGQLFEGKVEKHGTLYDFGLVSTIDVLWSSFSFSVAYAAIAVVTCNHAFARVIHPKIGCTLIFFQFFRVMAL